MILRPLVAYNWQTILSWIELEPWNYMAQTRIAVMHVLVIGGTGFIGEPTTRLLQNRGVQVSVLARGGTANPFDEDVQVHLGDRTDRAVLEEIHASVDPDIVVDLAGFYPADVEMSLEVFRDIDHFVYVSTVSAYANRPFPIVEDETPLLPCADGAASDRSFETYGERKAECERRVMDAVNAGLHATILRPVQVFGPRDGTERVDYWIDRVNHRDRLLVPGDGTNVTHQVFVDDVATAIDVLIDNGKTGQAYNCGARQAVPLRTTIKRIAACLDTEVELIYASERELGNHCTREDFPVYSDNPYAVDTDRLVSLGWETTDPMVAMQRAVDAHVESDRDGRRHGPTYEEESQMIESLLS